MGLVDLETDHYANGQKDADKLPERVRKDPTSFQHNIEKKVDSYGNKHKDGPDEHNARFEYNQGVQDRLIGGGKTKYAAFEHSRSGKYPATDAKSPHFESSSQARHWIEDSGHENTHVVRPVYK